MRKLETFSLYFNKAPGESLLGPSQWGRGKPCKKNNRIQIWPHSSPGRQALGKLFQLPALWRVRTKYTEIAVLSHGVNTMPAV